MRVPLSWLRDYVDIAIGPELLAEKLTLLGMEVQQIERRGDEWRSVVVGELLEVTKHPNADRLWLTRVRVGDGHAELSIVCGATNIAARQRVPVALPGATLPGERQIGVTRIAGVESEGMLCSGDELTLTTDADGILILPDDAPVGRPLTELYGDIVLDIDVKPNRGDALSLIGLAREVAAATGASLRWPVVDAGESGDPTADHVDVEVRERALCPRFVARYVDGLSVGPSPVGVQMRLLAAGMRPVSNVVDASNYVMLEMGKPTHAFDAATVADGRLIVRLAEPEEELETLDHVRRALAPGTLLIADASTPLAIAGVIGGAASEVSEATTSIIIESAIFDPATIRRTGQRYGLRSEASLRFEKGQEYRLARLGADRVAQLVREWAGGRVAAGAVDSRPDEPDVVQVPFRASRVSSLLGVEIETEQMRELLAHVEIETETQPEPSDVLVATVPTHRRDLLIEGDIAEEVARLRGYETIPPLLPDTASPGYRPDPWRLVDAVRDLLSGRGLNEVVGHALVGPVEHGRLGLAPADPATIRVANPLSVEHSELRRSLLPELMRILVDNERQRRSDMALFEVGRLHEWRGGQPTERSRLAIVLAGEWTPRSWDAPPRTADVWTVKGLIEWLAGRLGAPALRYQPVDALPGVEHPGRTAGVHAVPDRQGVAIGRVGELDPRYVAVAESRAERVAFADIDLAALLALVPEERRATPLPRVPAVERDLAVIVDTARTAAEVDAELRRAGGRLLREVRLFDRYEGPPLRRNEISLAYRLRIQDPERTLTDDDVERLMAEIAARLGDELGARFRT